MTKFDICLPISRARVKVESAFRTCQDSLKIRREQLADDLKEASVEVEEFKKFVDVAEAVRVVEDTWGFFQFP